MADNEIKEMILDLKKGQEERDKLLVDLKKGQEELFKGQEKLFKGQEELFKGQEKLSKDLDNLSLSVARIEADHGGKLDILLDVVTGHTEKFTSVNERVEKCEKRLDNHDDKIYVLNSVVQAY